MDVSAAPAKRWSGVCRSGVQSCQFQLSNSTNWFQGGRRARSNAYGSYHPERTSFTFST